MTNNDMNNNKDMNTNKMSNSNQNSKTPPRPPRIYTAREVYVVVFWGLVAIITVSIISLYIVYRICKYFIELIILSNF